MTLASSVQSDWIVERSVGSASDVDTLATEQEVQTVANLSMLPDANLREVLQLWDRVLRQPRNAPRRWTATFAERTWIVPVEGIGQVSVVEPFDEQDQLVSAYEAVRLIADWCELPATSILAATGVKRRTYHAWGKYGVRRPRLDSQGSLWNAFEVVSGLREQLGNGLAIWLHASPDRLDRLRRGDFDGVAVILAAQRADPRPVAMTRTGAVGTEVILPRSAPHGLGDLGPDNIQRVD